MALFNRNRFRALVSAFMLSAVLVGCGGGGGGSSAAPVVNPPGVNPPVVNPPVVNPPVVNPPVVSQTTIEGTPGVDTPTLNSGFHDDSDYNYDALGGNDVITITAPVDGFVRGGAGMDTLALSGGGMVGGNLEGGAEADTFMLTGGSVGGDVLGGAGNDIFSVTGAVEADLAGDGGNDEFTLAAALTGSIAGGGDDDTITLNAGASVSGMISGDGGADTFMLTGGMVGGNIAGGAGNDMFTWSGGTVGGYIDGGGDTDTFTATAAVNVRVTDDDTDTTANALRLRNVETITLSGEDDTLVLVSGSAGDIDTGGGNDELTVMGGVSFTGTIDGGAGVDRFVWGAGLTTTDVTLSAATFNIAGFTPATGFEVFVLDGGTIGAYTGSANADQLELLSGSVEDINAGRGNDRVTVTDGVTFTGTSTIGGGGDEDRFVWGEGLTTTGVTATGTEFQLVAGTHGVPDPTGFEVFVLDGGTIGAYTGSANADQLELLSGSVTGNINTGGGNDRVTVTGGFTFTGTSIDGGGLGDEDRFVWGAGLTTTGVTVTGATFIIAGPFPNAQSFEVFVLDGGEITGDYMGRNDAENTFEYISGVLTGTARGGTGAGDTFSAEGAVQGIGVTNNNLAVRDTDRFIGIRGFETIRLSEFDDVFLLSSTSAADTATSIDGGAGVDRFSWGDGLTTTGVNLSTTANTFTLAGTDHDGPTPGNNIVPSPINFEVFTLVGGTIGGYTGSDNADRLELFLGDVTGDINMGGGNDQVIVVGGVPFTGGIDGEAGALDQFVWRGGGGLTLTADSVTVGVVSSSDDTPNFQIAGTHGVPNPTNFEVFVLDGATIAGNYTGSDNDDALVLLSGSITGNIAMGGGNDRLTVTGGVTFGGTSTIDGGTSAGDTLDQFVWGEGLTASGVTVTGAFPTQVFELAGGPVTLPDPINFEFFALDGGTIGVGGYANGGRGILSLISGSITGPIRFTGADSNNVDILGDMVSDSDGDSGNGVQPALVVNSFIDDQGISGNDDIFNLGSSPTGVPGRVANIRFSSEAPVVGATLMDGSTVVLGDVHLQGFELILLGGGIVNGRIEGSANADQIQILSGMVGGNIETGAGADSVAIHGNMVDDAAEDAITLGGVINGGAGDMDQITLGGGFLGIGHAANIRFSSEAPVADSGDVHLQNIERIRLDGGTVDGAIDARAAFTTTVGAGITFDLISGRVGPTAFDMRSLIITGSGRDDIFIVSGDITDPDMLDLNGIINGGGGTADEVQLVARTDADGVVTRGVVARMTFNFFAVGDLTLRDVEVITIDGGTVNDNINFANSNTPAITFNLIAGRVGPTTGTTANSIAITGSGQNDIFIVSGDITDPDMLDINGVINGQDGTADEVRLVANGVVNVIDFGDFTAGELNLRNVETITLDGGTVNSAINASAAFPSSAPAGTEGITFDLRSGRVGPTTAGAADASITGSGRNDTFIIRGNLTNNALEINGRVQGGSGTDEVRLVAGGIVGFLDFGNFAAGRLVVQAVETITIEGGRANGNIDALLAPAGITFNLRSGTVTLNVFGSEHNDIFNLHSAIRIGTSLDGGVGTDVLRYAGAPAAGVGNTNFATARGGLAADGDTNDGDGSVQNIESQVADATITSLGAGGGGTPAGGAGAGLRGLTVRGIEVLSLSPALNLYGALSDALMQFGQQTAQGFALADLNLATGRATSLVSKDSPFTKGRIWAHKITHSGNGKGSIGLGLTGLTARADSDYDYEMSLTQHGFDAPLAATKLGAFNLRAVSHTMTGTIETNVAEAQVSGYGAGVALLWRGGAAASKASASATRVSAHHHHGLSAHITSLAGAYEVEAHTSPLNPRAVVNEVSEGSFSAINAVVSAGVADTRKLGHSLVLRTTADLVWQTLSLDDFSETGSGGIAINFDKATRFTARVGAGLESEHWFSDVAFVHETSSGGTLSSGLRQDYRQDDGTAIEMKFGGKLADLATGLTLKAYAGLRTSLTRSDSLDPSAHLALNWRF